MAPSRIRVIIVHETPLVRAGLEVALRAQDNFEIIPPSQPSGSRSRAQWPTDSTDVVLVPDCETALQMTFSGLAVARRVLIVTRDVSEASIRRAMDNGIRGYLLLTCTLDAVVRAIRSIHAGGTALDPLVAAKMLDSFAQPALTRREIDVLRLVMLGLPNKVIAVKLALSEGTVKTHLKKLRAKLNASSRVEMAAIAQRRGLLPEVAGGLLLATG